MKASPNSPPTAKLTKKSVIFASRSVPKERVKTPIRETRLIRTTLIMEYIQAIMLHPRRRARSRNIKPFRDQTFLG